jgi:DNA-binding transcriptional regulator GbsR (MarR family)
MKSSIKNKKKQELPTEYYQLLKSVGAFMEYWGFKAVHGKIWTAVYLSKDPVDANFMISQLQLSKAAISLGIKDLLHYNVIHEVPKNGPSTQKYISNPDLMDVICNVLRQREKKMLQVVVQYSKALSEKSLVDSPLSAQKNTQLRKMTEQAHVLLESMLQLQTFSFQDISTFTGAGSL